MPREDNVVHFEQEKVITIQELIDWSLSYQPREKRRQKKQVKHSLTEVTGYGQINEPWVKMLMKNPFILGEKGLKGRNNAVFTLALAYYASGKNLEFCLNDLQENFNRQTAITFIYISNPWC
ncbi:hypothetical protein A5810_000735 [Enterococcus faecium]|uniref:Primase C-terminal 1 domain-containing protein n=2 Tax=Enterococcus faecium TaxID=1352 RepID=A0A242BHG6_ENTFC|nr:hypothetical protein A5810_000735 [Enterococcus faecium]